MEFRISDSFTDSLLKLTGEEQKLVKTTAFDLQMNPANLGMQFHKIENAKDPNFWSVRVNRDIRIIVHKSESSLLLCYVDHHDKAYKWAERRRLETHPKTGAAQIVEIRETVLDIIIPNYVQETRPWKSRNQLFAKYSDDDLLTYGVPVDWLGDVRNADEESILTIASRLPKEAGEALLELAVGGKPKLAPPAPVGSNPFEHPDALRRFRIMSDVEELARALDYPWEKWIVWLHPEQRKIAEYNFNGPAKVSGSAGTGKTVVALHRAVNLTRNNPDTRVLLTTFSDTLANSLYNKLKQLISNEPRLGERIDVQSLITVGSRLYESQFGQMNIPSHEELKSYIEKASLAVESHKFTLQFLLSEWEDIVDAQNISTLDDYLITRRLGRKMGLPEKARRLLWPIFEQVRLTLKDHGLITRSGMFYRLASHLRERAHPPYDFIVVDEAQDISIAQLRFLAAMGAGKPNGLFFAGDLGQRIFQMPFSWKENGVDIQGRSRTLKINYRTTHQIRVQSDRLLNPEITDVDGNIEDRSKTISAYNGPPPTIQLWDTIEDECEVVSMWLSDRIKEGLKPHEIGVFVRSEVELDRAHAAAEKSGIQFKGLDEYVDVTNGYLSIATMNLAKGLEFRAVTVMACDEDVLPLRSRLNAMTDTSDINEVTNTERRLLYVACTRARDHLLITGIHPGSEYLEDLET